MFSLSLYRFSLATPATPAPSYSPKTCKEVHWLGLNVRVDGCMSLYVSPVMLLSPDDAGIESSVHILSLFRINSTEFICSTVSQ